MADIRLRHRARMRAKDVKRANQDLEARLGPCLELPDDAERASATDEFDVVLSGGRAVAVLFKNPGGEERLMLTVRGLLAKKPTKAFVTVDMGAVRFVNNGADIMAPGIVDADKDLQPGELVWIRDERNGQPLAVGEALMTGPDMVEGSKGKAVRNLHHVGDDLWNLEA